MTNPVSLYIRDLEKQQMKRRLIKQGVDTLTVTLPKSWITANNLRSGDEVDIAEQDNTLQIACEKRLLEKRKTIDISGLSNPIVWRKFIGAYRTGYDEIKIIFESQNKEYDIVYSSIAHMERRLKMKTMDMLQDMVYRFVGMEITDQQQNFCIVKDLGGVSKDQFDDALRRIFLLLMSMVGDLQQAMQENNPEMLTGMAGTDTNIDRFTDYCLRCLNRKGNHRFSKTPTIYSYILTLELVGDELKKMAAHLSSQPLSNRRFKHILIERNKLIRSLYELHYAYKVPVIIAIFDKNAALTLETDGEFKKASNGDLEAAHHIKKVSALITQLLQLQIELES